MNVEDLRSRISGDVVAPEDSNWSEARLAWNLAVDQPPALVVLPESADDVIEIAPQGTGHNAGPKAHWDSGELFKSNHPIPPATIVSRRPRRALVRRAPGRAARPVSAAR